MIKSSPWRAALAATVATFVAAVPLASAQSAYAGAHTSAYQPYPPELSTATVPAGGAIFFVAEHFQPGEQVTAALVPQSSTTTRSSLSRGGDGGGAKCENGPTYHANQRGTVFGCFRVPKDTPPGPYLFTLTGEQSGSVSAPVTVTEGHGHGHGDGHKPYGKDSRLNRASFPSKGDIEGQPGTVKVAGNGKTLSLRTTAAEEQPGSAATSQQRDLALAGYEGTGQDVSGGTGPAQNGSGPNWALVGGAAGLAAIAVRTVTVVRRRRPRTEQG